MPEVIECPECGEEMEAVEGVLMNEQGEAEYRGYKCTHCTYYTKGK